MPPPLKDAAADGVKLTPAKGPNTSYFAARSQTVRSSLTLRNEKEDTDDDKSTLSLRRSSQLSVSDPKQALRRG
eukprot:CAMPEP_0172637406 /NCGR_PEP_ID=MMETSP1068-20121228/208799_1 /TAXON_ID=35684 /ORGANISM="Pseudopedinella elastica, Strain CCMP716" /LENGTH=73 /DNA_ID=CAMNT_0013450053 /DNA_START=1 /DNA_END=218 /DNA_ORIENTATION=+